MPNLNYKLITHIMGFLLIANGGFMLIATAVSWFYGDGATIDLSYASGTTILIGIILMFSTRHHEKSLSQRDGYLIVSNGWILLVLSGMLPYIYTGSITDVSS